MVPETISIWKKSCFAGVDAQGPRSGEKQASDHDRMGNRPSLREFLHVYDMGAAVRFCLENDIPHGMMNVGSGRSIRSPKSPE